MVEKASYLFEAVNVSWECEELFKGLESKLQESSSVQI